MNISSQKIIELKNVLDVCELDYKKHTMDMLIDVTIKKEEEGIINNDFVQFFLGIEYNKFEHILEKATEEAKLLLSLTDN